jgi:hypothetical protein
VCGCSHVFVFFASVYTGVLMNTRGLVSLIVLNIGLQLGILSARVFTIMVLMVGAPPPWLVSVSCNLPQCELCVCVCLGDRCHRRW